MHTIEILPHDFTVSKLSSISSGSLEGDFFFIGKTDKELSLVCETKYTPEDVKEREDGWTALRFAGTLDFSLTGILSGISSVLADAGVGIFAVSTFDTDYILIKKTDKLKALKALSEKGYHLVYANAGR